MSEGVIDVREAFLAKLREGACSHAFILEGPDGVGKRETAKWFASALLCEGEEPPCGVCRSCRKVRDGYHPDLHIYGAEGKAVSVGDVRNLIRETSMRPSDGERMVFLLEDAQDMQAPAQNALLKVFEEPPEGVYLFLLTVSRKALLPTIRSRGQSIVLRGMGDEEMERRLISTMPRMTEDDLRSAIRFAEGSLGKAEAFLQKKAVQDRETAKEWLRISFEPDRYARISAFSSLKQKRETLLPLLDLFLRMMTDVLLAKTGGSPVLLRQEEADSYADRATRKRLAAMCEAILRCRDSVEANGNLSADLTRLAAEL